MKKNTKKHIETKTNFVCTIISTKYINRNTDGHKIVSPCRVERLSLNISQRMITITINNEKFNTKTVIVRMVAVWSGVVRWINGNGTTVIRRKYGTNGCTGVG